jgi:hypothetical protein
MVHAVHLPYVREDGGISPQPSDKESFWIYTVPAQTQIRVRVSIYIQEKTTHKSGTGFFFMSFYSMMRHVAFPFKLLRFSDL